MASRLLRNMPLLRLLKMQLLSRHSGVAAFDVQRACSGQGLRPCLRLQRHAPLFDMRDAVQRLERALQLMVEAQAQAPAGMHVLVADAGRSVNELV